MDVLYRPRGIKIIIPVGLPSDLYKIARQKPLPLVQEELNTRLNALLDKFAKEELEFLKAISEFVSGVEEYNSNLMRVFFDTARNHFIDLLDGLRNIKKAVFAPTRVFRIKSEDFFDPYRG